MALRSHFAPGISLNEFQSTPDLRKKFVTSVVAMATEMHGDHPQLAGEDSGAEAIVNLWLAGVDAEEIKVLILPLLQGSVASVSQDHVARNLVSLIEAAVLTGEKDMANSLAVYLLKNFPVEYRTVYVLEALHREEDLLSLGRELSGADLPEKGSIVVLNQALHKVRLAVQALARVRSPERRVLAKQLLLHIANALYNMHFSEFSSLSDAERADFRADCYNVALGAIAARGEIVERRFVDSERIELIYEIKHPEIESENLLRSLMNAYLRLPYRVSEDHFKILRETLKAFGHTRGLYNCGFRLFEERAKWRSTWFPTEVHYAAFAFFVEAGAISEAQNVLRALREEFSFVKEFSRDNRQTISLSELEPLLRAAVKIKDASTIQFLLQMAEQNGWQSFVEQSAEITEVGGEVNEDFTRLPELPRAVGSVLLQHAAAREFPSAGDRALPEEAEGWLALEQGDPDRAMRIFRQRRVSAGAEAVGDIYMQLHRQHPTAAVNFAACAYKAYLSAIFFRPFGPPLL